MELILIDMSVFWVRSDAEGMRPHGEAARRCSKARSYRPQGDPERLRGRRCVSHQGGRIAFEPRLATKPLRAVKTGSICEDRT